MPHVIIIAAGSNAPEAAQVLQRSILVLTASLQQWSVTPLLTSPAIGMPDGTPAYTNFLLRASTTMATAQEATAWLKTLERQFGDTRHLRAQGIVTLDLDLLLFDHERLHASDWERPYVKQLLQQL